MSLSRTDIWRVGIVDAPVANIVEAQSLDGFSIQWFPEESSFCFLADPFGFWRDGLLYVFSEYYDYRDRKGVIQLDILSKDGARLKRGIVLSEPWHLSYPVVFEADGEIWMLPEGYQSGALILYRAADFPWRWERVPEFDFPCAAIDASPLFAEGRWWMFYTPPFPKSGRTECLRIACAETLTGVWRDVSPDPVRVDRGGSRMGGRPVVVGDRVILPTQDCSETYGGGIRLIGMALPVARQAPAFTVGPLLRAPESADPYTDGLHTLSAAGDVTLIDVKRIVTDVPRRLAIDVARKARSLFRVKRG